MRISDLRFGTHHAPFDMVQCRQCRCFVTTRRGEYFDATDCYPKTYGAHRVEPLQRVSRLEERLHTLLRVTHIAGNRRAWMHSVALRRGQRILDVGCGSGVLGRLLMERYSVSVVGIDPSPLAAEHAAQNGLAVHQTTLLDFEDDETFDIVLLIHTLEHVANPRRVLERVADLLSPGGQVVIAVPNVASLDRWIFRENWDGWDVPRHIHHFTPSSLTHLLERCGFQVNGVKSEWYSLFARSLGNRWRPEVEFHRRKTLLHLAPWEAAWGLLQSLLGISSAMQVFASVRD